MPPRSTSLSESDWHSATLALHAGYHATAESGAVAVPIYQTTAYQFRDSTHAREMFALNDQGDFYTRLSNPTVRVLEERVCAIEGGKFAACVASGQAATMALIQTLAKHGDNMVAADNLYGGTVTLLRHTLGDFGIEVRMVNASNPNNFAQASDDKTRLWLGETLPNPGLKPFPIAEVAELGLRLGIPLAMDNTCAPILCRPFEFGAAIVLHSLTKYFGGSGNSLAGAVIDGGTFDWTAYPARLPALHQPDPAYHDIVWSRSCTQESPLIQRLRFCGLRDIGYSLSPFNAFLILQGMETLHLRMQAHCDNAAKVAHFLHHHPRVTEVVHPQYFVDHHAAWGQRYVQQASPIVGVYIDGEAKDAERFVENLRLFHHVSNIGDSRSLVTLPGATTQSQLNSNDFANTRLDGTYVRLSVGIEHSDDILNDLAQALEA